MEDVIKGKQGKLLTTDQNIVHYSSTSSGMENVSAVRNIKSLQDSTYQKIPILFRQAVNDIPSTTHGTFSVYQYPAKFIPQVIAYVLKHYVPPADNQRSIIFDPFAGHGTTGIVARVYGHHYVLWDLNPFLSIIHDTAIMKPPKVFVSDLLYDLTRSKPDEFVPRWKNLEYWFPEEFLPLLERTWGYVHSLPTYQEQLVWYIPLIKVTRYFSWADEKVHKLYKSKRSKKKIKDLLESDWKKKFFILLERELSTLLTKLQQYQALKPHDDVNATVKSGIDVMETCLDSEVDVMITSPPYLQAQEYIRSTKMALYWLGYDDHQVQALSKKEIPYRKFEPINIHSDLFHKYRSQIKDEHLVKLFDCYFHSVLGAFTTLSKKVTSLLAIFVSPATIRTRQIPIDDIFIQHLEALGWKHDVTYIDTIKARSMFEAKVNPASGLQDKRMETEHLIILKKE